MKTPRAKIGLALLLVLVLVGSVIALIRAASDAGRTHVTAYFVNSNGIYVGDNVVLLGVPIGKIERIDPHPERVEISFWYDNKYKVPAEAKAVILSPSLVTFRSVQLTPAYTGGAVMPDHAVIPQQRTAVPVEWDELRQQLQKLTQTLQPTQPGGVSTLGSFIDTAADNLRGQGGNIRQSMIKLSQAVSSLDNHRDLIGTIKNLSVLVTALRDSSGLLRNLNQNLAAVTNLLADDPDEVGNAVQSLNEVVGEVQSFVAENQEALGTTTDKLASATNAVVDSLDDIKQLLHIGPTAFQNFLNIYQPAQGTLTGVLALNNFANPIQFLCGAVEAASRLGAKEAAKLCVQYLAPIIKNRQYNFPPIGENLFVGATARPNELTYSEDWLRPDYVPPPAAAPPPAGLEPAGAAPPPPVIAPAATNPADGLRGIMVPPGGGR
jgi:phospholipid/cholesterol/gamma-HCH transport system substrate-binding protein